MFAKILTEVYFFVFAFTVFSVLYAFACCFIVFALKLKKEIKEFQQKIESLFQKEKEKEKENNDCFLFELAQSCKGVYLRDSIDFDVPILHLVYNYGQNTVYGLALTNDLDPKIHSVTVNTVDTIREELLLKKVQEPFTISLDRILRPSYRSSSVNHKVELIYQFIARFGSLEKLILHNNEKVDILRLNVCMEPLVQKIKKELGIDVEIWNTPEGGFIEKKKFQQK